MLFWSACLFAWFFFYCCGVHRILHLSFRRQRQMCLRDRTIGEHCILVAQVGIAGSTKIGNYVTIAGQVGVAGHLRIADKVTIAAQSGVMHHIPEGQKWLGSPAGPDRVMKRQYRAMERLPELLRRVQELEGRLGEGGAYKHVTLPTKREGEETRRQRRQKRKKV